jgi:hypothetical protein
MDAGEVGAHMRRLFHSVQHQHVFGSFPQVLRQIADIIDKEKEADRSHITYIDVDQRRE